MGINRQTLICLVTNSSLLLDMLSTRLAGMQHCVNGHTAYTLADCCEKTFEMLIQLHGFFLTHITSTPVLHSMTLGWV